MLEWRGGGARILRRIVTALSRQAACAWAASELGKLGSLHRTALDAQGVDRRQRSRPYGRTSPGAARMPNAPGLPPAGGGLRRTRRPDLSRRPRRHWPGSAASAPWAPDPGTGCRYAARWPSPCTRGWQDRPSPGHRRACRNWPPGQTHAPGRVEDHPGLGGYAGQQREAVGRQRVNAGRAMFGVCAVPVPAERGRPAGKSAATQSRLASSVRPAGAPGAPGTCSAGASARASQALAMTARWPSGSKVTTMPAPYFRPPSCTAAARAVLVTAPAPAILAASSTGTIVSRMTIDTTALTSGNFWPSRS